MTDRGSCMVSFAVITTIQILVTTKNFKGTKLKGKLRRPGYGRNRI